MTVGDGGCRPGTAKTPSSADNGRPAVIHMLGRDGRSWRRPVRPGKISDGTAVPGRRTGRLRSLILDGLWFKSEVNRPHPSRYVALFSLLSRLQIVGRSTKLDGNTIALHRPYLTRIPPSNNIGKSHALFVGVPLFMVFGWWRVRFVHEKLYRPLEARYLTPYTYDVNTAEVMSC